MDGAAFLALCAAVRQRMGVGRYRHSAGVARMAERLAARHGASTRNARLAGILHDIARGWKADDLLAYAVRHEMPVDDDERRFPVLLHAAVGADLAKREFGIDDPDVLGAIARHTVAGPGMSDLEKIVYMADAVEPSRAYERRAANEAAAFRSLDDGMLACVRASMEYLAARRLEVTRETMELHDQLARRDGGAA